MTPILSLWTSSDTKMTALKVGAFINNASADYGGLYREIFCDKLDAKQLSDKLTDSYRDLIKLTMADTTLHLVAVVQLYTKETASQLQLVTQACRKSTDRLSLHVIGLRGSLSRLLGGEPDREQELQNIELLDKNSVSGDFPYSFTIVDDYASNGAALDFSLNSFSEYLAMLFTALIQDYHSILPPALLNGDNGRNIAIGLSGLRFDRKAACQYLLNGAFLGALDAVNVNQESVDAQLASERAMKLLANINNRYPRFFDEHVLPLFRETNKTESEIAAEIEKPLRQEMEDIEESLTAILHDPKLSFPEKEAIFALVLGRDNPRLRGVQYDRDTAALDDACTSTIEQYVDAFNNRITPDGNLLPIRGDFELLKKYDWNSITNELDESPENEKAFNPLPELKQLKLDILNITSFIRRKEQELENLAKSDSERKQATELIPGDKKPDRSPNESRRRISNIKEQPLDETYNPPQSLKPKSSVDLRKFFSPIKSQGKLGSCSSFAVVSMYEAIMNRFSNDSDHKADLSERFVFYYSNVLNGKPEGGSNFYEQLGVLGTHGICQENLFNYTTSDIEKAPPEEAIEDAKQHRVLKALQIPLRHGGNTADALKKNHQLLTSALTEGHPVGIALKIYDNFGDNGPFINRPDANDISSGGEGYHAMVIAGYSEADKYYIVRNSWSSNFGDKGYAYISAAYIDDPEYNDFACIITETTENEGKEAADVPQLVASFAGTESQIREAAIRNVLDEAYVTLSSQKQLYEEHYRYYQQLMQRLCMPQIRNELRISAETNSADTLASLSLKREELLQTFVEKLRKFKHDYIRRAIWMSVAAAIWDAIAITALCKGSISMSALWVGIIAIIITIIAVVFWINYRWAKRKKHRELNLEMEEISLQEERAKRDFMEKQLRFHVAGMWTDNFHDLSLRLARKYDCLVSFNNNLRGWYVDEQNKISTPPRHEGSMFIYYENRDLLKNYFNANAAGIIRTINLMETFDNYAIDRETIQDAHKRLEEATLAAIAPLFSDFRISDYILGREYPYLEPLKLDREIARLISVGQPSVRHNATDPVAPQRLVVVNLVPSQTGKWQGYADRCFPYRPTIMPTDNLDRLDLITIQPLPTSSLK